MIFDLGKILEGTFEVFSEMSLEEEFYLGISVFENSCYPFCSIQETRSPSSQREKGGKKETQRKDEESFHLMSLAPIASFVSCLSLSVCS